MNYTLERDNRELQLFTTRAEGFLYYTLERDNRELQPSTAVLINAEIIPLREIIGNYNSLLQFHTHNTIIPLREIIGNYN